MKGKLLIFIVAVSILLGFYLLFLVPSMQDDRKDLLRKGRTGTKIAEVEGEGDVINDFKTLNMKISAFLKKLFSQY